MKRTVLIWFFPVALLAAASVPVYRLIQVKPDSKESPRATQTPAMLLSHKTPADSEHELKALVNDLEKKPAHVPVLLRIAQVSRELGRLGESARYLREAVVLEPKNSEARLELGRALFETGDIDGAILETERLLDADPSNVDALYNLGAIYGNLSQDKRARQYWEKAVALAPDSPSGRLAKDGLKKLQ